ncbi:MAG: ABC transporter ATP-binding protein [Nitrososphaerota archaeon]|nr:ABC transporter ATP-binding protein [Candidatus Calditenuaceae archaeon]MDW8073251.1 ABC transporter ATP-binding protein [Nitrososphaerota archaeon]
MEPDNAFAIVLEDVWKIYRIGKTEYPALRGLTLMVRRGEMLSVMGPSGSGKSTLLHIAGTLDRPTRGRVILEGIDISGLDDSRLSEIRNRKIGFVFQAYNLINRLSALENVSLPLAVRGVPLPERRAAALEALRLVGLKDAARKRPLELSGGEQQRVAIARGLVGRPRILLADEPTGNLDSKNAMIIIDILRNINKTLGTTLVIVTHNPEVAERSDRIVRLRDGRVESEVTLHA